MEDISVTAVGSAAQQSWGQDYEMEDQLDELDEVTEPESALQSMLDRQEEETKSLAEMIQAAHEKAEAQREALKVPNNTRYGDGPLEAYARLARAKNRAEVNAASGFARRKISQLKTSLRMDSDNAARIRSAINQLQKAITRGEKKKRDLDREKLMENRKVKSEEAKKRMKQELVRRRTQRMIRETGYLREADIADRLATQLTATQMELRLQAQAITAATTTSLETAVQQYTGAAAGVETAAPSAEALSVQG